MIREPREYYALDYADARTDILALVDDVFSSGQFVLGDNVRAFEEEFARYCGVEFGVGVDNGTNAIVLGLRALGVRHGDEVITVSNTAAPTVVAIASIGAIPKFVDIGSDYLMATEQLESVITDRVRCILPVHLYGQCVDMEAVSEIAQRYELLVLEDCAHAHGAKQNGRPAGSMSQAAAFSFFPSKVLGAYGDGGIAITNDADTTSALRRLRFYGMAEVTHYDKYYVLDGSSYDPRLHAPGYNSRLDEVQAAILRYKLARLDQVLERRRALAERYRDALADTPLGLPVVVAGNEHVFHQFVVRHPERERILQAMAQRGIRLQVWYRWPVHEMSGFRYLGYEPGSLPETERAATEIFSLPLYTAMRDDEQEEVCEALRACL